MTNYDFLEQYVKEHNGKHVNRQNYYIDGELTTYSTTICKIVDRTAFLNTRKYSRTTSKLQSILKGLLTAHGYKVEEYNGDDAYMWCGGWQSSDNKWTKSELKARGIF